MEPARGAYEQLDPRRRALVDELLARRFPAANAPQPRAKETEPAPLSFAQERFWILEQLTPGAPIYVEAFALDLVGALEPAALEAALAAVTSRHRVLGVRLVSELGRCVQVDDPQPRRLELRLDDLRDDPEAVERVLAEERARPFAFAEEGPLRARLIRLGNTHHVLVLVVHHVAFDAWSAGILFAELAELYGASVERREPRLALLDLQYADVAAWERSRLDEARLATLAEYWRSALDGAPEHVDLPTDRARAAGPGRSAAVQPLQLEGVDGGELAALARAEGATTFMVVLAAMAAVLGRYAGQDDLVLGTAVAGRDVVEVEGLIGPFLNVIPLRCDVAGDPSFRTLLRGVRDVTLGGLEHQDFPFQLLVDQVTAHRDLARNPLFNTMLIYENVAAAWPAFAGLEATLLPVEREAVDLDVTVRIWDADAGLEGSLEYRADLFGPASIGRIARELESFLAAAVGRPDLRLGELRSGRSNDDRILVDAVNATAVDRSGSPPVQTQFASQARRTPDAVALRCDGEETTYAALDARSDELAAELRAGGVGRGSVVAVVLERSSSLVAALLAVLKAGAAYVPIDPEYPRERVEFMLSDSGAMVMVTTSQLAPLLAAYDVRAILIDALEPRAAPPVDVAVEVGDSDLAYVLYSSGSTGRPKGIMVEHGSLSNLLAAAAETTGFARPDALVAVSSVSFDIAALEIYLPLVQGGLLAFATAAEASDGAALLSLVRQLERPWVQATPATWRLLVAAGWQSGEIRGALCGGDVLDEQLADEIRARAERCWNLYGPTETTIWSTATDLTGREDVGIGRPLSNTTIEIVDEQSDPVPVGTVGELLVGGAGVARGYLGQPALTAERFVPDPGGRSARIGARRYRTGDRVRLHDDGELEFLGRIDDQVKLRGFRIEPGEIEVVLGTHPGVDRAVVVTRRDGTDVQLVAYVKPADADAGRRRQLVQKLRDLARKTLPEPMVPSAYVLVDEFPLTPNRKLDRRLLPQPTRDDLPVGAEGDPPRGPVEEIVAAAWCAALGVESVGRTDNFFDLGGNSILTIRVAAEAEERGLLLDLGDIYRTPVLADLARMAAGAGAAAAHVAPFELVSAAAQARLPDHVVAAYPLSRLQVGTLFHTELAPGSLQYQQAWTWRVEGPALSMESLRRAIAAAVEAHPALRTAYELTASPEPLQLVHRSAEIPLEVDDLRGASADVQRARLAAKREELVRTQWRWDRPPLVRAHVHLLEADAFALTVASHHSLLDGWSLATFLAEVLVRYGGTDPGVPETSFADYVAAERAAIADEEEREFWARKLRGVEALALGADLTAAHPHHEALAIEIDGTDAQVARELAHRVGAPLQCVGLALHLAALATICARAHVVTGMASHGRLERRDADRALGVFLNMLPVCVDLSGLTWIDLVERVYGEEQALMPHRRYPLADIQRAAGMGTLFDTSYGYTHMQAYDEIRARTPFRLAGVSGVGWTDHVLHAQLDRDALTDRLTLVLRFGSDRVDTSTAGEWRSVYQGLLESMVSNPDGPALGTNAVAALTPARRSPPPPARSVLAAFAEQVESSPDAIALVDSERTMTYAELDACSDRLAAALHDLGVAWETPVAVDAERSARAIIAALGVWKAGGAYVPIDLTSPPAWVRRLIDDAGIRVLVGDRTDLPSLGDVRVLETDQGEDGRSGVLLPGPEGAAYIVYTSGSTGEPKGVVVGHGHLVAYVDAIVERLSIDRPLAFAMLQPLTFDLPLTTVFPALVTGGAVHVVDEALATDGEALARYVRAHRIDVMKLTPSHLRALLSSVGDPDELLPQRALVLGGEASDLAWAQELLSRSRQCGVFNHYGPTETTVGVSVQQVTPRTRTGASGTTPIGRPLDGVRLHVLDDELSPVAQGTLGELYVEGPTVARGYLARPGATAERFLPNPFGPGRVYRSGDLVRELPDGALEFVRRLDDQLKIRGYRVEPGFVEAAVRSLPSVRDAAVLRDGEAASPRLVAFVVPAAGASDGVAIQAELKAALPDYMVPARVVHVERIPLTSNGKVDRRALEDGLSTPSGTSSDAAREPTALEREIAEVWGDVLDADDDLTPASNFFELGGDSLVAMVAVWRVRDMTQVEEISIVDLVEQPTVEGFARHVAQRMAADMDDADTELIETLGSLSPTQVKDLLAARDGDGDRGDGDR